MDENPPIAEQPRKTTYDLPQKQSQQKDVGAQKEKAKVAEKARLMEKQRQKQKQQAAQRRKKAAASAARRIEMLRAAAVRSQSPEVGT
jgi:hypothetical protein